jgi:hypothetical protein
MSYRAAFARVWETLYPSATDARAYRFELLPEGG